MQGSAPLSTPSFLCPMYHCWVICIIVGSYTLLLGLTLRYWAVCIVVGPYTSLLGLTLRHWALRRIVRPSSCLSHPPPACLAPLPPCHVAHCRHHCLACRRHLTRPPPQLAYPPPACLHVIVGSYTSLLGSWMSSQQEMRTLGSFALIFYLPQLHSNFHCWIHCRCDQLAAITFDSPLSLACLCWAPLSPPMLVLCS
jgi:hypothetical protein